MRHSSQNAPLVVRWVILSHGLGADGVEYGREYSYNIPANDVGEVLALCRCFHHAMGGEVVAFPKEPILWHWKTREGLRVTTTVERGESAGRIALVYTSLLFAEDDFESRVRNPYVSYTLNWRMSVQKVFESDKRCLEFDMPPLKAARGKRTSIDEWRGNDKERSEDAIEEWRELCNSAAAQGEQIPSFAEWWPRNERETDCFEVLFRAPKGTAWTLERAYERAKQHREEFLLLLPRHYALSEAQLITTDIEDLANAGAISKEEWRSRLNAIAKRADKLSAALLPLAMQSPRYKSLMERYQEFAVETRNIKKAEGGVVVGSLEPDPTLKPEPPRRLPDGNSGRPQKQRESMPAKIAIAVLVFAIGGLGFANLVANRNKPIRRVPFVPLPADKNDYDFLNEITRKHNLVALSQSDDLGLKAFVEMKRKVRTYAVGDKTIGKIVQDGDKALFAQMHAKALIEGLFYYLKDEKGKNKIGLSAGELRRLKNLQGEINNLEGDWTNKYQLLRKKCRPSNFENGFMSLLAACDGAVSDAMRSPPIVITPPVAVRPPVVIRPSGEGERNSGEKNKGQKRRGDDSYKAGEHDT